MVSLAAEDPGLPAGAQRGGAQPPDPFPWKCSRPGVHRPHAVPPTARVPREAGLDGLERRAGKPGGNGLPDARRVGNPPFGHFGEYAINDWFERNLDALRSSAAYRRARATACCSSACSPTSSTSKATPRPSACGGEAAAPEPHLHADRRPRQSTAPGLRAEAGQGGGEPLPEQEAGRFYLPRKPSSTNCAESSACARALATPVAYIMEAADEISFCLADIEDSVEKASSTSVNWRICW